MSLPAEIFLRASPESAARARAFLREHARLDTIRHAEADLLITELIGNVIAHSPGTDQMTLRVERDKDRGLYVSVSHPHPVPLGEVDAGVGFLLLEKVSKSWGHEYDRGTLSIWFTVRIPGATSISSETSDDDLFILMPEDPASYSDELVRRHSDLASSIARRYRGKGIDEDDLLQVANMALLKAIQRYDPSMGSIRPYAAATISGELKRLLRDTGWSVRVPRSLQEGVLEVGRGMAELEQVLERAPDASELADHLGMRVDEVVEALEARSAYSSTSVDQPTESTGLTLLDRLESEDLNMLLADDRVLVEQAIAGLPDRERQILHLRFNEDMTQSEIAEEMGFSQMHVSRLLSGSFETIRKSLTVEE